MSNDNRRYGLGYALAPKKKRSFVQSKLVELARAKGIDMFCIDSEKPLADQGPFDCILHKVNGDEWKNELRDYENMYPGVCIIDRPEAIKRLHDRSSMLQVGCALRDVAAGSSTFCVPKQIVVRDSVNLLDLGGLRFPVIAKPLVADGSVKSHKMLLVYNTEGLGKLKPPLVLQEFVNHGGVIFKVYVVGDFVKCVRRRSLPDVPKDMLNGSVGSLSFCQISNLNKPTQSEDVFDAELPPQELLVRVAAGLRRELKLHLFNFDVIRDTKAGNRYLVIDINYFPGYAKMPGYEPVMADFFWKIFHDRDSLQRGISEDHSHHDYQHSLENGGADAGVSTDLKINGSPHIDVQGEADARAVNDSKGNASTSIVDENGEADAEAAIDSKGSVSTSTVVENGEATTDSKGNAHPNIDVENGEADKGAKIDSKGNAHPSIDVENGEADKGVKIDSKGNAYPSIDVENGEADKGVKIDSKGNASPGIVVEKGDDDVGVSIDSKKNRSRGIVFPIQDGLVSHQ